MSRRLSIKLKHIRSPLTCFHLRKKRPILIIFQMLFPVGKLNKFGLYITAHGECFIWEFLVLAFIETTRLNNTSFSNSS